MIRKLIFAEKYLEFSCNNQYVIVNPDINTSIKLNEREYLVFKELLTRKQNDLEEYVDKNESVNKLIVRLLASKLIFMNGEKIKVIKENQPRYHAVYWGLTENCNFRCIYCYAECGPEIKQYTESKLTLSQQFQVVDEIVGMGFDTLNFTGGEPLLNPNVFKIARYAKGLGLKCGILTNGSLITENNIKKFKIFDYVKVSLDSEKDTINDITRGKGTYKKIIRALDLLKDNKISTHIGSVVTKYNKDSIAELLQFINDRYSVVSHSLTNYIPVGRGKECNIGCSFEEIDIVNETIFQTKRQMQENNVDMIAQDVFYDDGKKTSCGMGMGEIFINYKADVYPCRMTYSQEYYLGNVLATGLKKALSNFDEQRKMFHVDNLECKDCDYKYLCGGGCRMYHAGYSGDIRKNCSNVCKQYKNQIKKLVLIKNGVL